ncbi:MAG: DUF4271 domain-containing protein [Bacteroidetes bacterium]|nr:DUF4271 domain-containing protein [Bacteroidota bacterium]
MKQILLTGYIILFSLHFMQAQNIDSITQQNIPDTVGIAVKENVNSIVDVDSLLSGTGMVANNIMGKRTITIDWFIPLYLLLLLIYFTLLWVQYTRQLRENVTVITNRNLAQQIYRDREFSAGIFSTMILLNFVLVFAIFLYQLLTFVGFSYFTGKIYLDIAFCGVFIPVIYFIRSLVYWMLSMIYPFKSEINFFRFNTRVLLQMTGICMLPLVILIATTDTPLSEWAIYTTIGLLIFVHIIRIIKGMNIGGGFARFHFFYFLLYLCVLEIAPLLILFKIVSSKGING